MGFMLTMSVFQRHFLRTLFGPMNSIFLELTASLDLNEPFLLDNTA